MKGTSTSSLGNLYQCLTTLIVENFFLIPNLKLPYCSLKPSPLVSYNAYRCKKIPRFLADPIWVSKSCSKASLVCSPLQAQQSQFSEPLFTGEVLQLSASLWSSSELAEVRVVSCEQVLYYIYSFTLLIKLLFTLLAI